jgi:hypothetical protein
VEAGEEEVPAASLLWKRSDARRRSARRLKAAPPASQMPVLNVGEEKAVRKGRACAREGRYRALPALQKFRASAWLFRLGWREERMAILLDR